MPTRTAISLPTRAAFRRTLPSLLCISILIGCTKVEPAEDYRRAAELVHGRTAAPNVYSPLDEEQVADRIDALLVDGLTVDEAVCVALLNNRDLQGSFYLIGASRAEVVQSQLLSNPTLTIVPKFPDAGGLAQFNVGFAQELVDLWQIPVRKKMAEAELEAVVRDIAHQVISLAADVRTAAYDVLTLRQTEATVRQNFELVERSENLAKARYEAGEASQLDINLARSNALDVRLELIQVRRQRRLAETTLGEQLSFRAPARDFELVDTLPEPIRAPDEQALLATALERRFDVRAAEYRVQAAEATVGREWLNTFPSVTAGLELERPERRAIGRRDILADTARASIAAGSLTAPSIESRAQRQRAKRQEIDSLLGPAFGATLPIWNQNQASIAAANFRLEQQRKQLESLTNQIAAQVTRGAISLRTTAEIVEFYRREAIPQAEVSLDSARQLYEAGESGILGVIQAQQSLLIKRRACVTALGEYAAALAELERTVGGPLPLGAGDTTTRPAAMELDS